VDGGELSHGLTVPVVFHIVILGEVRRQHGDVFARGHFLPAHDADQCLEPQTFHLCPAGHLGVLLIDVLLDGLPVQYLECELGHGFVGIEVVGEVSAAAAVIALTVEVDGPYPVLDFLEIRRDIDDVVHAAHVSEEADEAALIEFGEFLGDTDLVQLRSWQVIFQENISWNPGDVLFDQGVSLHQVIDAVRGKDVLQLQAIDARGIRLLHIEVVGIVIEEIGDPDAERARVSEFPEIHAVDGEVIMMLGKAAHLQLGVDFRQLRAQLLHDLAWVVHGEPEGFFSAGIFVGDESGVMIQVRVNFRNIPHPVKAVEILPQQRGDGIHQLFAGDLRHGFRMSQSPDYYQSWMMSARLAMGIYRALTDTGVESAQYGTVMRTNCLLAPLLALVGVFCITAGAVVGEPITAPEPKVQMALLLDTSSSMEGLIQQAKTQLWKVVNSFAEVKKDGKVPYVEVALYEYGNSGLFVGNNWIRQIRPMTRDLDSVSKDLFELQTNGGDEYCGAVIQRALADLQWDASPGTYKVIFIAGNEPFTQGPVDARQACRDAAAKHITVNTIHCGNREEGINGSWNDGAALAEGKFLCIDQDKATAFIPSPQDDEISKVSRELSETYVAFGAGAAEGKSKQSYADSKAVENASAGSAISRAVTKASSNYSNGGWDLVDAVNSGKKLSEVPQEQLPEPMRKMSPEEQKSYLGGLNKKRSELQEKIRVLNQQREAYVAKEMEKKKDDDHTISLDQAMIQAVRDQAKVLGYQFTK
jgi:von Willebrand factor type A domain